MVIAALVTFAVLLVAWLAAPSEATASGTAAPKEAEPLAASA